MKIKHLSLKAFHLSVLLSLVYILSGCGGSDDEAKVLDTPLPIRPATPAIVEEGNFPENFYFGNDLSYLNEMEDCGASFRLNDEVADPYQLYADMGNNLVRVRNWNDPYWTGMIPQPENVAAGRKMVYSDLEDNLETIRRSKEAGMDVIFDFHFSDFWADPGRQAIPRAWEAIFEDQPALEEAVYEYVTAVLTSLDEEGLLPEIISIGNESNGGMMTRGPVTFEINEAGTGLNVEEGDFVSFSEERTAAMYNAGISAVRDFGNGRDDAPQIALHITIDSAANGGYDWIVNTMGVTDFDILGLSYYYAWHNGTAPTIPDAGNIVRQLKEEFPNHDVMILETGYLWDNENIDGNGNIITTSAPEYLPVSKQNQLKYMVDLSQEIADAGGSGVIFWESAWVSTECRTPWGQGSSHEHVAFFDHRDNNNFHLGGTWMNPDYYLGKKPENGTATTFKVDMTGADVSNGVFIRGDFTYNKIQPMLYMGNNVYSYTLNVPNNAAGSYHILNGPAEGDREAVPQACADIYDPINRAFAISGNNLEISSVWQSCEDFNRPTSINVRFNVDMSPVEEDIAVITGPFNGWSLDPMTSMGEGIYSIEYTLEPGSTGQFYFRSAEDWSAEFRETVPEECALVDGVDRMFELPDELETISINVVWGSCDTFEYADPEIPEDVVVEVTLNVDMTGQDVSNGVWIAGDLNEWSFQELSDQGENIYSITMSLPAGETFAYYYLNDDDWGARETGLAGACDVLVFEGDRGLTVASEGPQTINNVWGSCAASVTLTVDMGETDTSNGVWIAGEVNGWTFQELTETDTAGVFSITLSLARGQSYDYYFLNDDDWGARETGLSGECSVLVFEGERGFTVGDSAEQTLSHQWGVCNTNVTLTVDMTSIDVSNGVWVTGEFNDWTFQPLTDQGGNIYAINSALPRSSVYAYYFLNDDDWGARETGLSGACSVLVFEGDRGFEVSDTGSQVVAHVWGQCD